MVGVCYVRLSATALLVLTMAVATIEPSVAQAGGSRRENPAHFKQMAFLREENARLAAELNELQDRWHDNNPTVLAEQRRIVELQAQTQAGIQAAAEAEAQRAADLAKIAAENARKAQADKEAAETSLKLDEHRRLTAAQESELARDRAAELANKALLAKLEKEGAAAREAAAKEARLAAEAEIARWEQIRLAAEMNVTAARSQGPENSQQIAECEAKRWAAEEELEQVRSRQQNLTLHHERVLAELRTAEANLEIESAKASAAKSAAEAAAAVAETAKQKAEASAVELQALQIAREKADREAKIWVNRRAAAEAAAEAARENVVAARETTSQLSLQVRTAMFESKKATEIRLAKEAEVHVAEKQMLAELEAKGKLEKQLKIEEVKRAVSDTQSRAEVSKAELDKERVELELQKEKIKAEAEAALAEKKAAAKLLEVETQDRLQRERDERLVRMQEESASRQEQAKAEEAARLQAERLAAERELADAKVKAEVEGRIRQERENEDVKARLAAQAADAEKAKWMSAISLTFDRLASGAQEVLQHHLPTLVTSTVLLAGGVYAAREGMIMARTEILRRLSRPKLVRETSIQGRCARFTAFIKGLFCVPCRVWRWCRGGNANADGFADVVLPPDLDHAVRSLARSTRNAKRNHAPLRHAMFYGPPGTGKTMVAQRLAKHCGLDYAIMSGGDVAPLGAAAVEEMHTLFTWAKSSPKGLVLFIDEAEAFLGSRDRGGGVSEHMRNVLSALLYQTGTQSHDYMLVLATNRPEDLDSAITDRVDEALYFGLPALQARQQLVNQYFVQHILSRGALVPDGVSMDESPPGAGPGGHPTKVGQASSQKRDKSQSPPSTPGSPAASGSGSPLAALGPKKPARRCCRCACRLPCRRSAAPTIYLMPDVDELLLEDAARATEGFSGRQISKLMLKMQGAVYGSQDLTLDAERFRHVLDMEVAKHNTKTGGWLTEHSTK